MHVHANVVDTETGETHGTISPVSTSVTLMPGVYDLRFRKCEWRYVRVDGGKTTTLRPAAVILAPGLKWSAARIANAGRHGGLPIRRSHLAGRAAATEGEVFEVKPQ